jgi:hypothetical protein
MDANIVNALGTFGFGGGVAVALAYFFHNQFKVLTDRNKETVDRLCETHKAELERVCDSFDRAVERRDKDFSSLVSEIRTIKSGIING